MRTLCVMSRKGGTGKTTISTSLAIAAHLRGLRVLLADIDPQRSAHYALSSRGSPGPACEGTSGGKLFALKSAVERNTDLFIIDTPAGLDACIYQAAHIADLCLVVTRPNYLDLAAALDTTNVLRQLGQLAAIVLSQAPAGRDGEDSKVSSKAREALRFVRYPVAATALCSRLAYARAVAEGRSVEETSPGSAAAWEISQLWAEIASLASLQASSVTTGNGGPRGLY